MQPKIIYGNQFNKVVLPLLESAKESVKIIIFDWRFESLDVKTEIGLFNTAIVRTRNRGIDVRCIVNSKTIAQRLTNLSIKTHIIENDRLMHIKLLIIDDRFVVVGSHNYSNSAFSSNYEISFLLDILGDSEETRRIFDIMWKS
jgi:phosphatidylserine/phosphatidylglycerophosphate/cardiolipin synthase-like enzyme